MIARRSAVGNRITSPCASWSQFTPKTIPTLYPLFHQYNRTFAMNWAIAWRPLPAIRSMRAPGAIVPPEPGCDDQITWATATPVATDLACGAADGYSVSGWIAPKQ